jgi:beta-glucanase (GH16 family)
MATNHRKLLESATVSRGHRVAGTAISLLMITGCAPTPEASLDEASSALPEETLAAPDDVFAAAPVLVWQDNFDGTTINRDTWTYDVGVGVWNWGSNQELQYYTDRPQNSYIENGNLVIEARREAMEGYQFTSARLKSTGRVSVKHGWIEARIKVPNLANGLWPAFWLLGNKNVWPASGELDIMEMGYASAIASGAVNRRVGATAHWDYQGSYAGYGQTYDAPQDLSQDYHVYKLYWDSTVLRGYVDDVNYWTMDISSPTASLEEFKSHQFYIILNLAVGGAFPNIFNPAQITAPLPAKMYVDYVRIYSVPETEIYIGAEHAKTGTYGVFTDTTPVTESARLGLDTNLYLWNNLTATSTPAFEGTNVLSVRAAANNWFGLGFASDIKNMSNYSDGFLRFHLKTTTTHPFEIGISSAGAGEGWVRFENGGNPYGVVRDGQWHAVAIPLNKFSNIDFHSINQLFMLVADAPASTVDIAIDNIHWTPSVQRPAPSGGNFGVFTDTTPVVDRLDYPAEGDIFVWENTLQSGPKAPYEGTQSLSYTSTPGLQWFGLGVTPNVKHNLTAYRNGFLSFALKTTSTTTFRIGMKSGNVDNIGQSWITFASGSDPYGFVRNGQWHRIQIPLSHFSSVDLSQVSQVFELLGTTGPITGIELDDIYFGGATPPANTVNRALNRPAVASSSEAAPFGASQAVDGNAGTRWSSAFADPQWIYVDLGQSYALSRVVLRWEAAYGRAYQVQVSSNATTWTTIKTVTGGDGGVDDLAVSGTGRYVRILGTERATPYGYSLFELEVY